jgi:hypothetical protein
MISKEKKVYRYCTYLFIVALLCHLLLAIFIIFNPNKDKLTNQRWEKAYRLFGLTGPFFSENRLNSIQRVYCSIKEHGNKWGEFHELGREEFNRYHQLYFNYDQILLSGFPRYLCRQINIKEDSIDRNNDLRAIKKYIQISNPSLQIDSVTLVYTIESLVETRVDTFFVRRVGGFEQTIQQ